jgi:hypothetical protein
MKRPLHEDGRTHSSSGSRLEAFLGRFLERHPRLLVYAGVGLLVLMIVAVLAKLSGHGH